MVRAWNPRSLRRMIRFGAVANVLGLESTTLTMILTLYFRCALRPGAEQSCGPPGLIALVDDEWNQPHESTFGAQAAMRRANEYDGSGSRLLARMVSTSVERCGWRYR